MSTGYNYKSDDLFYDVESLDNIFTVAWWYPKQNAIILSYVDDDSIIQSEQDLNIIRERIFELHPRLKKANTLILFENIKQAGFISEYNPHGTGGQLGMQSFAKRLGLTNQRTHLNASVNDRGATGSGVTYHPAYYPVKQTDPDFDENVHGYRFGYNSTNYDLTMLAYLLATNSEMIYRPEYANQTIMWDRDPITAKALRAFNDDLFTDKWRGTMATRLANPPGQNIEGFGDFRQLSWIMRKGWLLTGRYIDVSRLNEKMQKVGLKRILGMLGLQIMESEKLEGNTTVSNIDEFADLFAYNISDVVNLQLLFEHKVYQNAFNLRGELLETYPQTVYGQIQGKVINPNGAEENPVDAGNYTNIRRDRLARDSTSAKFVEYALAPYKPIKDREVVSFLYPSIEEAKSLGIPQLDILEETKKFFEKNVTSDPEDRAHKDFMQVYTFYDKIRGRNFNTSKAYNMTYTTEAVPKGYIKELMNTHNTNLFYHFKESDGTVRRTSCLANFSVGGIHGAEVNMKAYEADLAIYEKELAIQAYVESLYPSALDAINGESHITLPSDMVLTDNIQKKVLKNGTIKIRDFMKSGSSKKRAEWRNVREVSLFRKNSSGNWQVHPKYAYVSVGVAHHEDFASYYPLLLSRLSAFVNPSYHGYDKNGKPADPYYEMFLERISQRDIARDKSKPKEIRDSADLVQELRKLLINAASGAGDASFDNNIRANNAIMSMRIIGQLFAWRIGQAQALAGARVPSTNTDGLYTMDISAEVNDKILEDIAKDMYIQIEPERLDRFVSKDSNNRLEYHNDRIIAASGGDLNSWRGPQPTQNLSNPAIIDKLLVEYLSDESIENPANVPFDRALAERLVQKFIDDNIKENPQEILKYFQWILASSSGTHRYHYVKDIHKPTGEYRLRNLQMYNRIFLLKDDERVDVRQEIYLATRRLINQSTWKKRNDEYSKGERNYTDIWEHDEDAKFILGQNNFDIEAHNRDSSSNHHKDQASVTKVNSMPEGQHTGIYNNSIVDLPNDVAVKMVHMLDVDTYIDMLANTFKSWSNL